MAQPSVPPADTLPADTLPADTPSADPAPIAAPPDRSPPDRSPPDRSPPDNATCFSELSAEPADWQLAMKRAIRSQSRLRQHLGLPPSPLAESAERFPTFVPLELASRIRPADPDDPILRQVLATDDELVELPGYTADPVGDRDADAGGGVLHKYSGRALIVTHGACAVHCRYCFRREFPYSETGSRKEFWTPALEYIRNDSSIEEVLLSGGDPLTLTDGVLQKLIDQIESISHVQRLRIHTRLPIAIPQRITKTLIDRLAESRLSVWVVIHTNHANEIDERVANAIATMKRAGISLLNQSVLLAGVNDDTTVLAALSKKLVNLGVQPYYLHQLDRVRGAGHFWVEIERGKRIIGELQDRLPGYAIPKYVIEQAGEKSKTPIA